MSSGGKRRWDQAPAPEDTAKAVVAKVQAQLAEKGLKFAMKARHYDRVSDADVEAGRAIERDRD